MESFKALVVQKQEHGAQQVAIQTVSEQDLPPGDVLIAIRYSSLNYKDGLAVTGKGKIIRSFPMVPGVDLVGTVVSSDAPDYRAGDVVVLTGWGVGERHWGGYAQMARVRSEWLLPLPPGLRMEHAMAIGSAGLTAMLCVMALEEHTIPTGKPLVVTGATGGVGSFAVTILANLGYEVVAATGRPELHDYLRQLGASAFLRREDLVEQAEKPLVSERWGGAIDTVGGKMLAGLFPAMAYGCSVAMCGLAADHTFSTTVYPFILRGVNALGIDSAMCPVDRRKEAWKRLATTLHPDQIDAIMQIIPLEEVPKFAHAIIEGKVRGRLVVDVGKPG